MAWASTWTASRLMGSRATCLRATSRWGAQSFVWPSPSKVATRCHHLASATTPRRSASSPWHSAVPLYSSRSLILSAIRHRPSGDPPPPTPPRLPKSIKEDIYTIPNLLTIARIASTPVLGYMILQGDMKSATALLFFAGITDLLDGWLARRMKTGTVFGSIADPAADKILMTTMVVCLTMKGLMPLPLAILILGRDVLLILSAFIIRYRSLPPPRTFSRYWDFSLPSATVVPTTISKYNTFLQLLLVGASTVLPACPEGVQLALQDAPLGALQAIVAITTIWSGASYLFGSAGFSVVGGGGASTATAAAATAAKAIQATASRSTPGAASKSGGSKDVPR